MISTINNEYLEVRVKSIGAELTSIKTVKDDFEYLWQGDPAYWSGQAPVLFPVIGMLEDLKYTLGKDEYELESHGFARNSEFVLVENEPGKLVYQLEHSNETLKKYPFKFLLELTYILDNHVLITRYTVKNTGDQTMWYSIGAHPAFNCPLEPEKAMEDYVLEFEQCEQVQRRFLENGLLGNRKEVFLDDENTVKLSHRLFDQLAIVLKGIQSKHVTLKSEKAEKHVTVTLDGFPYLGIWSPVGEAPFVCIEPWFGVSSTKGSSLDIREKEGILSLEAGKTFECELKIIVA